MNYWKATHGGRPEYSLQSDFKVIVVILNNEVLFQRLLATNFGIHLNGKKISFLKNSLAKPDLEGEMQTHKVGLSCNF